MRRKNAAGKPPASRKPRDAAKALDPAKVIDVLRDAELKKFDPELRKLVPHPHGKQALKR